MPSQRVTRETLDGRVYCPDELPRRRGDMETCSLLILVPIIGAVCLADGVNLREKNISFLVVLGGGLSALLLAELLMRAAAWTEECRHLRSRHKGSHLHLLKKLFFGFTSTAKLFIIGCMFFLTGMIVLNITFEEHFHRISGIQFCGIIVICNVLQHTVDLSKNPVSDSIFLEKLRRLDYGSGIAQSFFYGYLRLCLPNTGDQEKGIVERIEDYISREDLTEESFPVKKLFILIPSSTYVPNDLKDCSFGWMKSTGTLEKFRRDRAGVKERVYKNTVYRIKDPENDNDKGVYVVAEGATPCKTLYETVQHSGTMKEFYKEHQKEIIYNFYETLRETLREDRDCRGLCELMYYVDTDQFGGHNVNVGKLILKRIKEIQETEEFLKVVRERNV